MGNDTILSKILSKILSTYAGKSLSKKFVVNFFLGCNAKELLTEIYKFLDNYLEENFNYSEKSIAELIDSLISYGDKIEL
jgi:hypothetical protein